MVRKRKNWDFKIEIERIDTYFKKKIIKTHLIAISMSSTTSMA